MIRSVRMFMLGSVLFTACAGTDGETGPAGPAGPAGPTGPQGPGAEPPEVPPGFVYTQSNDATANAVFVYARAADGKLTPYDVVATGGVGTGGGLGNQGALAMSAAAHRMFAVNAGDSSLSTFEIHDDGSLELLAKIGSGGAVPISVAVSGDTVYVVNAGNAATPANIAGFRLEALGLRPIAGSTQPLSAANPAPAQIGFSPDGTRLVVTEKGTNKIDTYALANGVAGAPMVQTSAGATPFGFAFDQAGHLIVSEAAGGALGASTMSSYALTANGTLTPVSSAVASAQSAACWVAVIGAHVYTTNTRSNNLSSYTIAANGALVLAAGTAAPSGPGPIDVAATAAGDHLYAISSGGAALSWYTVAADGSLTRQEDFGGIPEHASGLIAL